MHDREDDNTPRVFNAFSEDFLRRDAERDEPADGDEPEAQGPWVVLPAAAGQWEPWPEPHGMWPLGERPERGDQPAFAGAHRSTALLSSIVRPITGREPFYQLGIERWRDGYPLLHNGRPLGWMEIFHEDWAWGLSLLERVARDPMAVALVLEAAGPSCRKRAGAILLERMAGSKG